MAFLERGTARLYYEVHGTGPAIVFVHGVGGNHAAWFQQVAVFARSYQVITFDQRGFGNSTDPEGIGRSAFVDDLAALLDHLAIERCALVGQSMGGGTCAGFVWRYPKRVAALLLADTLQGLVEPPDVAALMMQARASTDGLSQSERVLGDAVRLGDSAKAALYLAIASFNAADRRNLKGAFTLVPPAELASCQVPILFVVGQQDRLFPPAAVQAMHRHVPGSIYVEISDTGHSAYFECPVEFNDSVLSFLQAVRYKGIAPSAHSNAPGYSRVG